MRRARILASAAFIVFITWKMPAIADTVRLVELNTGISILTREAAFCFLAYLILFNWLWLKYLFYYLDIFTYLSSFFIFLAIRFFALVYFISGSFGI